MKKIGLILLLPIVFLGCTTSPSSDNEDLLWDVYNQNDELDTKMNNLDNKLDAIIEHFEIDVQKEERMTLEEMKENGYFE